MRWCVLYFGALLSLALLWPVTAQAEGNCPTPRFFHEGDGFLSLSARKNSQTFKGRYRLDDGCYVDEAIQAIEAVFDAPAGTGRNYLEPRLIAFLDFLQDQLGPEAHITIVSGYRSPSYNRSIRGQGALAAKASLHQYGMAADLIMADVPSRRIWRFIKKLGFGGSGYYHGKSVHVDVGPARTWDEKTSGVGTGLSDNNKLIGLVCNYDRYLPDEPVTLRFIRMTAFPISVQAHFELQKVNDRTGNSTSGITFRPKAAVPVRGGCLTFSTIEEMNAIRWHLPADLDSGRYRIRARFCGNRWPDMPDEIVTPEIEIQ